MRRPSAILTTSPKEPGWHRRDRRARAKARLRFAKAKKVLENHHGTPVLGMGSGDSDVVRDLRNRLARLEAGGGGGGWKGYWKEDRGRDGGWRWGGGSGKASGKGGYFPRDGDWECQECRYDNFAWRNRCGRCNEVPKRRAPSPKGAGGSRPLLGSRKRVDASEGKGEGRSKGMSSNEAPKASNAAKEKVKDEDGFTTVTQKKGGKKPSVNMLEGKVSQHKEVVHTMDVENDRDECIGSEVGYGDFDFDSTDNGDRVWAAEEENEDLEGNETAQERIARLKREWDEAAAMVGHIKRKGRRAGDVVYDTAMREADEAEAKWRRERGPIPLDRRQRKNREAITRAETRMQKAQADMEDLEAEYQKKKAEMQERSDEEAGKIAELRREAADLRKEEADGDGMAQQFDYGGGEQVWEAAQKATVDINAWGAQLTMLVEVLGDDAPPVKQAMLEVLASMANTQGQLRTATEDKESESEEEGNGGEAMDWSQREWDDWRSR